MYILAKWANAEPLQVFPLPTEDSTTEPRLAEGYEFPHKIIQDVLESGVVYASPGSINTGSSCCIPMKSRTNVVGAVYLENTLLKGAFPEQQQTMLEHLACQIVSIIDRNELNRNLKNTLLDVQKRANMLEALNKMKDDFVTSTSHELRTPLNAIMGFSEILLGTPLDEDQLGYCEVINASAEGLLGVINDILDFQRCQNNSLRISPSIIKLRDCLDQVFRLVVIRASSVNLVLDIDDRIDDNFCIECDPLRIQQILLNLLSNALKFTERGHVILRVRVEDDPNIINNFTDATDIPVVGTVLKIIVEDTGIGIDPAKRSEMFKPFSQLDSGTTRKYMGTGLGLTITQSLVKILTHECSKVDYESTVGVGTKFFFHLPSKVPPRAALAKPSSKDLKLRQNSLRLMERCILVVFIPDENTRKFFLHEIRSVDYELKRFTSSIKETEAQLTLLRKLYQVSLIICYIDTAGISESDLAGALTTSQRENALTFLMTTIDQRRHFQSMMSSLPNSVCLLNKPFYKDYILNYTATVIQRSHVPVSRRATRAKSIGKVKFPRSHASVEQKLLKKPTRSSSDGEVDSNVPTASPTEQRDLPRILMVEDNKMNQKVQVRMLKLIDLECDIAENGRIAIDKFLHRSSIGLPYDLILMDFHMPEMDGREATCVIRSQELRNNSRHIDIVCLTAEGATEADGMCTVIPKPIKKASFHQLIPLYLKGEAVDNCHETTRLPQ